MGDRVRSYIRILQLDRPTSLTHPPPAWTRGARSPAIPNLGCLGFGPDRACGAHPAGQPCMPQRLRVLKMAGTRSSNAPHLAKYPGCTSMHSRSPSPSTPDLSVLAITRPRRQRALCRDCRHRLMMVMEGQLVAPASPRTDPASYGIDSASGESSEGQNEPQEAQLAQHGSFLV